MLLRKALVDVEWRLKEMEQKTDAIPGTRRREVGSTFDFV